MLSVVMPFYNTPLHLTRDALESVCLQDVEGIEVVIVDDGSAEEAARGLDDLAAGFRDRLDVRVVHQANAGAGAARNRAVQEAKHDLLAQLDSDDRWLEEKAARQLAFLRDNPNVWMVSGGMAVEEGGGRIKNRWGPERVEVFSRDPAGQYLALLDNNFVNNSTACFRRSGFEALGGYDASFRSSEDTDLWVRACRQGLLLRYQDVPMAVQVFHGGNLSQQKAKRRKAWVELLDRELRDPPGFLAALPAGERSAALAAAWLKLGRYAEFDGRRRLARESYGRSFALRPSAAAGVRWALSVLAGGAAKGKGCAIV